MASLRPTDASPESDALSAALRQYEEQDWESAYRLFQQADEQQPLGVEHVECLARSAFLLGQEDVFIAQLERAYQIYAKEEQLTAAARSAFWVGITFMLRGEVGPAMGWFARAQRTLENHSGDCSERGYLLLPVAQKHIVGGDCDAAFEIAAEALRIGQRFDDRDLVATALHMQGRARLRQGRVDEGLALLDETMIAVTGGELSPRVTGMIYCSVIEGCQQVHELARARQWTSALARWCDAQPSLVTFTGTCRVHRAQVLKITGEWGDAASEAEQARERLQRLSPQRSDGAAVYQLAEIHRLRGDLEAAEDAYKLAAKAGYDPQPGLALLRLVRGKNTQALASIDRALETNTDPLVRTELLPAAVEIHIAGESLGAARTHCAELEALAEQFGTAMLQGLADDARGRCELASGDYRSALVAFGKSAKVWQQIPAPYLHARTRLGMARACHELDDEDGCALELEAARSVFEALGASSELEALNRELPQGFGRVRADTGLTARELEVLRLVAAGKPNKVIAATLHLSVKTVDRHLSNIFNKLNVSSRAEATAYAYRHELV